MPFAGNGPRATAMNQDQKTSQGNFRAPDRSLDPALVALVRYLARRAAQRDDALTKSDQDTRDPNR